MRVADVWGMTDITLGIEGDASPLRIVPGGLLYFSGGRAVLEGREVAALRRLLADWDGCFWVEVGRVGLAGCRLVDVPPAPSSPGSFSRSMPRVSLTRPILSFHYGEVYDPMERELMMPSSTAAPISTHA